MNILNCSKIDLLIGEIFIQELVDDSEKFILQSKLFMKYVPQFHDFYKPSGHSFGNLEKKNKIKQGSSEYVMKKYHIVCLRIERYTFLLLTQR